MRAFRAKGERYVARVDEVEREVIARLAGDVAELLGASGAQLAAAHGVPQSPDGDAPADPAVGPTAKAPADPAAAPWDLPPLGGLDHVLSGVSDERGPSEPRDSALRRLLPAASEDAEVAEEFRRFTQVDLRAHKIERLLALIRALHAGAEKGRLAVPRDRADLLAGALVDIRLVLADRLALDTDEAADGLYDELARAEEDDELPAGPAAALRLHLGTAYAALTWLQESLVTAQLADLDTPDA